MRKLQIDHRTEYHFSSQVTLLPHRLLLRPRESHGLRIASSELTISVPHTVRWQRDAFDNSVANVSFANPTAALSLNSQIVIEHFDETPLDFIVEDYAAYHPFAYLPEDATVLAPLCAMAWPEDRPFVARWLRTLGLGAQRIETFALLDQINRAIGSRLRYEAREAPGVQPPAVTLSRGSGSCRDFAALFLEACRHLGIASRFVSGYHTSPPQEIGPGSTHAWAEAYLPGPGWKGFDPTAGVVTGSEHIAVAVARHPEMVPPVAGSFLGAKTASPSMLVWVRVNTL